MNSFAAKTAPMPTPHTSTTHASAQTAPKISGKVFCQPALSPKLIARSIFGPGVKLIVQNSRAKRLKLIANALFDALCLQCRFFV